MCGIAGFVHRAPLPGDARLLADMIDALAHRGPDGRGFFLAHPPPDVHVAPPTHGGPDQAAQSASTREQASTAPDLTRLVPGVDPWAAPFLEASSVPSHAWLGTLPTPQVGLANRRLAIVDRAGGRQPVFNETGAVIAVLNGELYNYRALQRELRAKGHLLRSGSDSEVLVHLYEEHGIDGLLERLQGMFAFALWDAPRQRLFLARDRFGKKPLYFTRLEQGIRFASELKGLLAAPDLPREIDPGSVARYLLFEAVPAPRTIYRHIHQLEPGTWLEFSNGALHQARYYHLPDPASIRAARARRLSDHEQLERLEARIFEAVRARLMGEVPMGALLSGGLDSGLITAMMARLHPGLHTFSAGFEERSFDESGPAALTARHLGTTHHPLTVTARDLPTLLEEVLELMDEPLADGSLIPTFALARHVRSHGIIVALSGDGGDEAFGGYPTYLAHRLDPLWDRVPGSIQALAGRLVSHLPTSFDNLSLDFKLKRLTAGISARGVRRHALWMAGLLPAELAEVLTPEMREELEHDDLFSELEPVARLLSGHRFPETAQLQDLSRYLPDDVLVKMDRASMAVGLEVRAPLLDTGVVTAGLELPPHLKLSLTQTKVALRRIGRAWLPPAILRRPKKGFGMPTALWLRDLVPERLEAWLRPPPGAPVWFDPGVVRRWVEEHRAGRRDHRKRLWPLLVLERWRTGRWGPRG